MDRVSNVKSYLPEKLSEIEPFKSILEAEGVETGALFENIEELQKQFFIQTAATGLTYWEEFLGLDTRNISIEERRAACLSRVQGNYPSTKKSIEDIVKRYTAEAFEILEYFNTYRIRILFDGGGTHLYDARGFVRAITDVLPAHIFFASNTDNNTHCDLAGIKHINLRAHTHNEIKTDKKIAIIGV